MMTVKELKEKEECATCIYYNTDRKDQPCYSCVDWENWEKGIN